METITIRPADVEDAQQIAELISTERMNTYPMATPAYQKMVVEPASPEAIQELARDIEVKDNVGLCEVLEINGDIAGVVVGERTEEGDELKRLFVAANQQGKGYGKVLLGRFFAWSILDQYLWVATNNKLAEGMYERQGFHIDRVKPWWGVDFALMLRSNKEKIA